MTTGYRPEIVQSAFIHLIGSHLNRFWSLVTPRLRLVARQTLNDELVALQFETNQAFKRQAFATTEDWYGGQYISLTVPIGGIHHQRNYSLVGLSQQPLAVQQSIFNNKGLNDVEVLRDTYVGDITHKRLITIAIKPQGLISNYLTEQAKLGSVFDADIPKGEFTLSHSRSVARSKTNKLVQQVPSRLLFIAGGSGITPMLGLITQALEQNHHVTLLYYHRSSTANTPFLSYWQHLAAHYKTFNYYIVSTIEPDSYLAHNRYLTKASLLALQLPLADTTIFACGSPSLLQNLYQAASEIKLSNDTSLSDNIIVENFGTASISIKDTLANNEADIEPQNIILRGRQQRYTTEKTLLLGAEQAGLRLPHGCRQGICQMCRCQKISGIVKNIQTGKLSTNGFESIQTCINVAMSEIILEV